MCSPIASAAMIDMQALDIWMDIFPSPLQAACSHQQTDQHMLGCAMLVLAWVCSTVRYCTTATLFQSFSSAAAPQLTEFGAGLNAFCQ